jgi:hypothetical protein
MRRSTLAAATTALDVDGFARLGHHPAAQALQVRATAASRQVNRRACVKPQCMVYACTAYRGLNPPSLPALSWNHRACLMHWPACAPTAVRSGPVFGTGPKSAQQLPASGSSCCLDAASETAAGGSPSPAGRGAQGDVSSVIC